ncbi:hypothetical protein Y032_0289g1498 [Ancylostoma ceylanicum]|uniref:Calponin-homology (CH) domain-containing protein n=1 Tax=Ancylostoma ceylanicum TaxID=53326 RepID=A0A016S5D5_9BILA|nr:hypothetical protein Y032_0289g1498 [Ancylostoma ceylanicum]
MLISNGKHQTAAVRDNGEVYSRRSVSQSSRPEAGASSREHEVRTDTAQERRHDIPSTSERGRNSSQPPMRNGYEQPSTTRYERRTTYRYHSETRIDAAEIEKREQLEQWLLQQPLEKRKLDLSDRQVAMLADERDGIQKKTFTKWVNKHLAKAGCKVDDLFVDLRDGFSLITLLEVLTGERLPRENGYTRFHRIQNVQYCLDFLKKKSIKLVNIRPEDIVEGNGKLTLGLIWTIILNFQVSVIKRRQLEEQLSAQNYNSTTQARISVAFAYSTLLAKIAPKNIALPIHAAALPNLFCEIAKRAVD